MRNTIRNRCSPRSTECFLILFMGLLVFGACDPGPSTEGRTAPSSTQTAQAYEKGAWQWRRHAEFNEIARRGDIDLVFLGDSITQQWAEAGKEVWNRYYGRRKAANFGISGDRTQHVLWRIEHGNFDGIHPKAIVLLIGDNNSIQGDTPQEIAGGVRAVVQTLRDKVPESKILLLAIFPSGERPESPQRVRARAANAIFQKVADGRMIRYLDIGDRFTNRDGTIQDNNARLRPSQPHWLPLVGRGHRTGCERPPAGGVWWLEFRSPLAEHALERRTSGPTTPGHIRKPSTSSSRRPHLILITGDCVNTRPALKWAKRPIDASMLNWPAVLH
jgi:lysophospholipase L1-like esterase